MKVVSSGGGGEDTANPIPVTILSGFLGAGKTTLLNHILTSADRRIGVLVNDFGSINVDAELISSTAESTDGEIAVMELANGCACCSVRTDLMQAVLKMATKSSSSSSSNESSEPRSSNGKPFDHIVVEASGVADPLGVYQAFLERDIRKLVLVDGVITVVDADHCLTLEGGEAALATQQIQGCDMTVLNKVDLLEEGRVSKVEAWIRGIKPSVPIFHASYGRLPLDVLLGSQSVPSASNLPHNPSLCSSDNRETAQLFETWHYESAQPINVLLFQQLLNHFPSALFRVKGFLYSHSKKNSQLLFQMVGKRAVVSEHGQWGDTKKPATQLVFIARRGCCDFEALEEALQSCELSV